MSCSYCGAEKVRAKGFCGPCYMRFRNTGSVEYKRKGKPPELCSVEDCTRFHVAKGYCDAHYRIFVKYGTHESPFGYGDRQSHHLYHAWGQQKKCMEGRVEEWNDFWKFVNDVGEKPTPRHRAKRLRIKEPWGPNNFFWQKVENTTSESKKLYRKSYALLNPGIDKHHKLKKQYGFGLDVYMDMYNRQDGKCYICGREGVALADKIDQRSTLCVDHCHKHGHVRKLLCYKCNHGLGYFDDDVELMLKAAAYLEEHHPENT